MKTVISISGIVLVCGVAAYLSQTQPESSPKKNKASAKKTTTPISSTLNCCAYTVKEGFLGRLRGSSLVLNGRATKVEAEKSSSNFQLTVGKILKGQEEAATLTLIGSKNDPHIVLNQTCLYFLNPIEGGYAPLAVVPISARKSASVASAVQALVAFQSKESDTSIQNAANAMLDTYRLGNVLTRDMISRDFAKHPLLMRQLDKSQLDVLLTLLQSMPGNDQSLSGLILMLGYRHDYDKTRAALVAVLAKEEIDRAFPTLLRVMQKREPKAYCTAIVNRWETTDSETTKEVLAKVLARLGIEEGRTQLRPYLKNTVSVQMQAEALIAHAGQEDGLGKSLAFDVVRKHLHSSVPEETTMAKIMKDRQRRSIQSELVTGERYRLMAAGYYLAQMKDEKILTWLKSKLPFLDDAGCAEFIQDRVANRWANFDAPF